MLSVKYHLTYWAAIAILAVAIYQLLALSSPCDPVFRFIIGPLAAYTIYASLKWDHGNNKKTKLALYTHQALIAYLLVALGSVTDYFQLPNEETPQPTALIRLLSAFVTAGVLESLRQNRRDIEPASFRLVQSGPRTELYRWSEVHGWAWRQMPAYLASTVFCDAILFGILLATDRVLQEVGGMSLRNIVPYWGWKNMQYPGRMGSAVVSLHLGGPFADVAETTHYVLCRIFVPHLAEPRGWMPKLGPLVAFPYFAPYFEMLDYLLFWLPRAILLRDGYDDGASLDGSRWGVFVGRFLRVLYGV